MRGTRTIFVDLDDTIASFRGSAERLLCRPLGEYCRDITASEWEIIEQESRFYLDLKFVDGAEELMSTIKKILFKYQYIGVFLSAIPRNIEDKEWVSRTKAKWVNRHFPYMRTIFVDSSMDKLKYCEEASILIDDKADIVREWNKLGGYGLVLQNCYDIDELLKKMFDI